MPGLLGWRSVRRLALLVLLLGWRPAVGDAADEKPSLEYQVKAAFLLNFTKFIEWPASAFPDAAAPFGICVAGKDPFGSVLDEVVQGETVQGHRLTVVRIGLEAPAQMCHMLYFPVPSEASRLAAGSGVGVLTVSEGQAFVRDGGMVAFTLDNHRVRFDINQTAVEHASLKISSRLLSVARTVLR